MSLTPKQKRYMKKRREWKRDHGFCVDCQKNAVKLGINYRGQPFSCCETCLQARRDRASAGTMPPLFRAIARSDRVH